MLTKFLRFRAETSKQILMFLGLSLVHLKHRLSTHDLKHALSSLKVFNAALTIFFMPSVPNFLLFILVSMLFNITSPFPLIVLVLTLNKRNAPSNNITSNNRGVTQECVPYLYSSDCSILLTDTSRLWTTDFSKSLSLNQPSGKAVLRLKL